MGVLKIGRVARIGWRKQLIAMEFEVNQAVKRNEGSRTWGPEVRGKAEEELLLVERLNKHSD